MSKIVREFDVRVRTPEGGMLVQWTIISLLDEPKNSHRPLALAIEVNPMSQKIATIEQRFFSTPFSVDTQKLRL